MNYLDSSQLGIEIDIPSEPEYQFPIKSPVNLVFSSLNGSSNSVNIHLKRKQFSDSDYDGDQHKELSQDFESDGKLTLIKQIKELQQEINEMNKRVMSSEVVIKEKETEAFELKELLIRLKENQTLVLETCEKESNCKRCDIL